MSPESNLLVILSTGDIIVMSVFDENRTDIFIHEIKHIIIH